MVSQEEKLALLKTLLLTDDRKLAEELSEKLEVLEATLRERQKLSEKISPIVQEELEEFAQNIPEQLGPVITKTLKIQIEESKDEVVEALYPILGKMIKKYISNEIKMLSENIEKSTKDVFSLKSLKRKIKSIFSGVSEREIILSESAQAQIEQVYVIEKGSGILLGSYSIKETVDQDMISGMLTAIKAFVEDAFRETGHDLQSIEYDLYEIHIHSFHKYYIAAAISGTFTETLENQLENFNLEMSKLINDQKILHDKTSLEQMLNNNFQNFSFSH
ncbi:cell envelope biogenesis protein OmpA [Nonlabens xiamenensis]|uniref:cell envelope biogenesis protein OmpA n=1 Tax=Nonlabens xiamenensis TaxID=2341043 RepID=UPI000F615116|nr:cell envelope biogenesis protein OmpA [Nonlabens xiamenensis]